MEKIDATEEQMKEYHNRTLASELLAEVKQTAKRWFIIAIVELGIIFALLIGFLYYITLLVDVSYDTIEQVDNTNTTAVIGAFDRDGLPKSDKSANP